MFKKFLALVLFVFYATSSLALVQYNITPTVVGSYADGVVYIGMDINTNGCLYSGVVFQPASSKPREALSMALLAKSANKLIRIDFTKDAAGNCIGYAIFLQ